MTEMRENHEKRTDLYEAAKRTNGEPDVPALPLGPGKNWKSHMHTEGTDPDYGYPLTRKGDWALDENGEILDDNISEEHNTQQECVGSGCNYHLMTATERKPFEDWHKEYNP
jgi:hypothetical protein